MIHRQSLAPSLHEPHGSFAAPLRARRLIAAVLAPVLLSLICSSGECAAASDWRPVPSSKISSTLTGHELADGFHFTYAFHSGGRFTGVEMARDVRGTWRVDGDEFCWTLVKPKGPEECMTLRRRGRDIQFMRDGVLFLEGTLSKSSSLQQRSSD